MTLPINRIKTLPRKNRRRIWHKWWKNRRAEIPGGTRQEKRKAWRALWGRVRQEYMMDPRKRRWWQK